MFCVSNDALQYSLWDALRNSLWISLRYSLRISLKSVYKDVEYVLCVKL